MTRCPTCGRDNAADARFCSECGASLVTRVRAEERRRIAALFVDLVGSTGIGERLDPEVMRSIVGGFFELVTSIVQRHGGTVKKFAGDAVLAVFGLAAAHEDDAERAVRAALAIRDGLAPLATDARARHAVEIAVRIGVEAGEVVVGDPFGGSTMATGDVLNVTARLEQQAATGEVAVGERAHAATIGTIRYEQIGHQVVRGREAGVAAWRAVAAVADLGGERGVPGLHAPLTGRDGELELLLGAQRRVVHERKPVLFTLLGVPGIGKSRLVREFADRATRDGARVVRGRSLPYGDGITYWALSEMVREVAGIDPKASADEAMSGLASVMPDAGVAERLGFAIGVAEAPAGLTAIDREIAWAFRRFVEAVAARQPLVLVFEDVHWAEPAMLDLIEHVATWARGVPVLLICTSRPELLDHRPGWGSGRLEATRIHIEPLDQAHSSALLSALLDIDDLPAALRDQILGRAEGNPLFVEEVVRMLVDGGAIVQDDGRWTATPDAWHVAVPDSVEAIIRARLDTLPRPERALLQAASVVGRVFERSAVAVLVDDGEPLDPRLEEAILRDLVSEEPVAEPSYRFKHILIRDVAYASLPKARRAELHGRVAAWLLEWGADRSDEVADIRAYHLEQRVRLSVEVEGRVDAALWQEAAEALVTGSDRAASREDFRAQESLARRAIELPGAPAEPTLDVRWKLVAALQKQNDIRRAGDLAKDLARDAAASGRHDIEGRALFAAASSVWVATEGAEGAEVGAAYLARATELLEEAGDMAWLFEAQYLGAYQGWWYGDLDRAYDAWSRAEKTARALGDPGRQAIALTRLAAVRRNQARVAEARSLYEQARELAATSTSRTSRAEVASGLGVAITLTSTFEDGRRFHEEARTLYEELGDRLGMAVEAQAIGTGLVEEGEVEEGIAALHTSVALLEEVGHGGFLPESERELATAFLVAGDLGSAEVYALRAVASVAADDWATVASTAMVLGRVRAAQGRTTEAEALLRKACAVIDRTDFGASKVEIQAALAEFLFGHGRTEEGDAWASKARALAARWGEGSRIRARADRRLTAAREAGQVEGG